MNILKRYKAKHSRQRGERTILNQPIICICSGAVVAMMALATGCADELDLNTCGGSVDMQTKEITLPGYLGIRVSDTGNFSTRADIPQTSDGHEFHDGESGESVLTFSPGYHFAIVYSSASDAEGLASTPLAVIPLAFSKDDIEDDEDTKEGDKILYDNLTLTAHTIVASSDFNSPSGYDTIEEVQEMLEGNQVFVLLNFDQSLVSKEITVPPGKTNAEVLSLITKNQFLNTLALKDYRIWLKEGKVVSAKTSGSTPYFTMSNSVYLKGSDIGYSYTITPGNVFKSKVEAEGNPAIEAKVERLASKFTVNFSQSAIESGEEATPTDTQDASNANSSTTPPKYSIQVEQYDRWEQNGMGYSILSKTVNATIEVVGYGLTGVEPTSYALKKINNNTNYFRASNGGSWNDVTNSRSYWAEDPHYKVTKATSAQAGLKGYPHQFRRALEHDSILSYHAGLPDGYKDFEKDAEGNVVKIGTIDTDKKNSDVFLNYNSFNSMLPGKDENVSGRTLYSLENTYYDEGMAAPANGNSFAWNWEKEPYSAATTFILAARLKLENVADGTTLYRGQNDIYYINPDDLIKSKIEIMRALVMDGGSSGISILHGQWDIHSHFENESSKSTHVDKIGWDKGSVLWIKDGNQPEAERIREASWTDFTLIPAEISGGDGQNFIAPKDLGPNITFYLCPAKEEVVTGAEGPTKKRSMDEENYTPTVISYNHIISLIHKVIGPIDVFTNGYMYYAVPVTHNVGSLVTKDANGRFASWKTLGDIGVVRNNWYNLTVKDITSVGTPVDDPTQPIVPVMDIKRSYINIGVTILGWHTIKQNDVPLSKY